MESRFRVENILDFSVYKDFQRSYACVNPLTLSARIVLILISFYYIRNFDNPVLLISFLGIAGIILVTQLIQNKKGGTTQYRRMLVSNNGNPNHAVCEFTDTGIVDTNQDNGNTYTYRYDQVRYLIHTPKLVLVVLKYRLCLVLNKDNITGGTPEELVEFLLSRCPNCRKKVKKITLGLWVNRIVNGILIAGCIWALLNIPGVSVMDKLSGKLTNSVSYQEMAEQLEPLGIRITSQTIEEMEAYDREYLVQYGREFYRANSRASKVQDLLYWEGSGVTDPDTMEWTPSVSGIYWMDMEVWNAATIYTDFLTGLDAMTDGITVTNIREEYADANLESGTGSVSVSFVLNGESQFLEAWYNFDWFDMEFVLQLGAILEADGDPENLYVSDDGGQGLYFFYGDEETVRRLSKLTGLPFQLASRVYSLY